MKPAKTKQSNRGEISTGALALSKSFANRGLVGSVRKCAEEQMKREAQTRAMEPEAYRLSGLSEETIDQAYRQGKEFMSSDDVLRYFQENRQAYLQHANLEGNTGIDECGSDAATGKSLVLAEKPQSKSLQGVLRDARERGLGLKETLVAAAPSWLDFSAADTSKQKRRFPLSAFAAVLAVAMSLMLIVASSVMVTRAENDISKLEKQIANTATEYSKLKSDLEVKYDLLEIRRIAIEEYGMVDEDYLKMHYISLGAEDSVEQYEDEGEKKVGLSALLSALGIK